MPVYQYSDPNTYEYFYTTYKDYYKNEYSYDGIAFYVFDVSYC